MNKEILSTIADLMALSARTAPKTIAKDFVVIKKFVAQELAQLADAIDDLSKSPLGRPHTARDAKSVRESGAVLLVGLKDAETVGANCGICGFATCKENEAQAKVGPIFKGPVCALRVIDLGIALGSAARTAMDHTADNRIMFSIGQAAVRSALFDADVAIGIPLSGTGKSPYFDR